MDTEQSDYMKYRGKCKEFSQRLIEKNPSFKLVRGHYMCPFWGAQPHWWCEDENGNIQDPTSKQFPSGGFGEYVPFDGNVCCEVCSKEMKEEDAQIVGNYAYCSFECYGIDVGVPA